MQVREELFTADKIHVISWINLFQVYSSTFLNMKHNYKWIKCNLSCLTDNEWKVANASQLHGIRRIKHFKMCYWKISISCVVTVTVLWVKPHCTPVTDYFSVMSHHIMFYPYQCHVERGSYHISWCQWTIFFYTNGRSWSLSVVPGR